MYFSRFDFYLIHDFSISKDAVEFALSFYGFGFRKWTSYSEEVKNTNRRKSIEVHCTFSVILRQVIMGSWERNAHWIFGS